MHGGSTQLCPGVAVQGEPEFRAVATLQFVRGCEVAAVGTERRSREVWQGMWEVDHYPGWQPHVHANSPVPNFAERIYDLVVSADEEQGLGRSGRTRR